MATRCGPDPARAALLSALALLLAPTAARAADSWTDPAPGLRHLHRTEAGPLELHALLVDLCDPSIALRATRSDERQATTSSWGRSVAALAAVNADFFNYTGYAPIGLAVGDGQSWPGSSDGALEAVIAAGADGRVELRDAAEALGGPEPWMQQVVSGRPNCLVAGVPRFDSAIHFEELHPRTAVGLSADGRSLVLLAVDGRSPSSRGATTEQVGRMLAELGARDGVNLDGGGSTTLWIDGEGVVNSPSDGSERAVANHLGVIRVAVPAGEPSRCCAPAPVAGATGTFGDLPDAHFAREPAEALYVAGVTSGCSASPRLFCPDCRTTRGQAVVFLVRALGRPLAPPAVATFTDVPPDHPQFAEVERAFADGITSGCGGGRFCPDQPASRAAVALFVARGLGAATGSPAAAPFSDLPVEHAAAGAVAALVEACIVGGCGGGAFCPDRTATRAELAAIVARAAGLVSTSCEEPGSGGAGGGGSGGAGAGGSGGAGAGGSGGAGAGGSGGAGGTGGGSGAGGSGGGAAGAGGGAGGAGGRGGAPGAGGEGGGAAGTGGAAPGAAGSGSGERTASGGSCGCSGAGAGSAPWLVAVLAAWVVRRHSHRAVRSRARG